MSVNEDKPFPFTPEQVFKFMRDLTNSPDFAGFMTCVIDKAAEENSFLANMGGDHLIAFTVAILDTVDEAARHLLLKPEARAIAENILASCIAHEAFRRMCTQLDRSAA